MNNAFIGEFSELLLRFFHRELPWSESESIILLLNESVPRIEFVTFLNEEL